MSWPPCGRGDCPVLEPVPGLLSGLTTTVWPAGERYWRSLKAGRPADAFVTGGDGRFSPLDGYRHVYLGRSRTVTLLETAFRDLSADGAVYGGQLAELATAPVTLRGEVVLYDLRDPELHRLGVDRAALTTSAPAHYPCTRTWAAALAATGVAGGCVWHSRQADQYRQGAPGGLAADVLVHTTVEVAVLWQPLAAPAPLLLADGDPLPLADQGGGATQLAVELANLLGVPIL